MATWRGSRSYDMRGINAKSLRHLEMPDGIVCEQLSLVQTRDVGMAFSE
jgi:hypothetical protein